MYVTAALPRWQSVENPDQRSSESSSKVWDSYTFVTAGGNRGHWWALAFLGETCTFFSSSEFLLVLPG